MSYPATRWRLWCGQTMLGWWSLGTLLVSTLLVLGLFAVSLFIPNANELRETADMFVLLIPFVLSCGYGIFRSAYFHPLFHRSYGEWLLSQPWTPGKALPLGPWHFVWQDGIYLALLTTLMSLVTAATRLFIPNVGEIIMGIWQLPLIVSVASFVITYSSLMMLKAAFLREPVGAYALAFFLGAIAVVWISPYLIGAYFLGLILAAHVSSRRMLAQLRIYFERQNLRTSLPKRGLLAAPGVWPFDDFLETTKSPLVPLPHVLLIAALAAWCTWSWANLYPAVLAHYDQELPIDFVDEVRGSLVGALIMATMMIALWRFLIYWSVGTWPFGFLARIKLRQWIVPGFDVVLIAPLVMLTIGVTVPPAMLAMQFPTPVIAGVSVFLVVLAAFGMGPTIDTWRHVGHHRMRDRSGDRRTKISTQ